MENIDSFYKQELIFWIKKIIIMLLNDWNIYRGSQVEELRISFVAFQYSVTFSFLNGIEFIEGAQKVQEKFTIRHNAPRPTT